MSKQIGSGTCHSSYLFTFIFHIQWKVVYFDYPRNIFHLLLGIMACFDFAARSNLFRYLKEIVFERLRRKLINFTLSLEKKSYLNETCYRVSFERWNFHCKRLKYSSVCRQSKLNVFAIYYFSWEKRNSIFYFLLNRII